MAIFRIRWLSLSCDASGASTRWTRSKSRRRDVWRRAAHLEGGVAGLWAVCAWRVRRCWGRPRRAYRGLGTHANEREGSARVNYDFPGSVELCVGADVVVLEALHAAAGKSGGRTGADVDTAAHAALSDEGFGSGGQTKSSVEEGRAARCQSATIRGGHT